MEHRYIRHSVPPQNPDDWFRHLFGAKAALDGGVVRRKIRDVERMVGRERFCDEIRRRGFTALENGDQIVVFCNSEAVRLVARSGSNFQRKFEDQSSSRI